MDAILHCDSDAPLAEAALNPVRMAKEVFVTVDLMAMFRFFSLASALDACVRPGAEQLRVRRVSRRADEGACAIR